MRMNAECILRESVWPISTIVFIDTIEQVDNEIIRKVRLSIQDVIDSRIRLKSLIFDSIDERMS